MFRKIKRYIRDPYYALGCDMIQKCPRLMSDRFYIKTKWQIVMGYKLDLQHPKTFNEKLQWLKLYDHNPLYTTLVDKIKVKDWVAEKIGDEYIIPTLAVWDKAEDVDIDSLPNQFVLKCNHDSGSVIVCRDKSTFDLNKAKVKLRDALKKNFFYQEREWPYKNVRPKVFAEEYVADNNKLNGVNCLIDYKFYCFNGIPQFMYISQGLENHETARISYVTLEYETAPYKRIDFKQFEKLPSKPFTWEEMLKLSKVLSSDMPFARVDRYEVNRKLYFSEITFYPGGGMTAFYPNEYDEKVGNLLVIR